MRGLFKITLRDALNFERIFLFKIIDYVINVCIIINMLDKGD